MVIRNLLIAAIFASVTTPALGQSGRGSAVGSRAEVYQAGADYLTRSTTDGGFFGKDGDDRGSRRECLKQNRTGRTYCMTRGQWASIANGSQKLPD